MSVWNTLISVCSKKKESGESEGNSPTSDSMTSSSSGHVTIEMDAPVVDTPNVPANPVDKPITSVEKPATPVATTRTPVSSGKRVQTPVTPIKGAGPEPNPSWISNTNQTQASDDREDSEKDC